MGLGGAAESDLGKSGANRWSCGIIRSKIFSFVFFLNSVCLCPVLAKLSAFEGSLSHCGPKVLDAAVTHVRTHLSSGNSPWVWGWQPAGEGTPSSEGGGVLVMAGELLLFCLFFCRQCRKASFVLNYYVLLQNSLQFKFSSLCRASDCIPANTRSFFQCCGNLRKEIKRLRKASVAGSKRKWIGPAFNCWVMCSTVLCPYTINQMLAGSSCMVCVLNSKRSL